MNLAQKNGIALTKGASIALEMDGKAITQVMVGINWGIIEKRFIGFTVTSESVDLDSSIAMYSNGKLFDNVYYKNLKSKDGSVVHSGDDRTGDQGGDDGADNEVIKVNLKEIDSSVDQIVFYLNSYKQQDFKSIPYAKIRLVDASLSKAGELANFNIATDNSFKGFVSMVLGKFVRKSSGWEFISLGEPLKAMNIDECIEEISKKHL